MSDKFFSNNPYYVPVGNRICENMYYRMHNAYLNGNRKWARFIKLLMWRLFYTYIPPEVSIGEHLILGHHGFGVVMHFDTQIGTDAIIMHHTTFGNGKIRIGKCFTIGAGATVIGPINIGDYVTIAPNSYVNQDIPDYALIMGNPAKIIKIRSQSDIDDIRKKREQYF